MRAARLYFAVGTAVFGSFIGCGGSTPHSEAPAETQVLDDAEPPQSEQPAASDSAAPEPDDAPAPDTATQQEPAPKPDVPPEGSSLNRIMQAHFQDALLIRKAVITGRSEDVAEPAAVIANIQNLDGLPKGWRVYVEQMQQTAQRINNSTTASKAAAAAADLGVSCGMCHQRHGGPKTTFEPAPEAGTTVESRMKQHIWATERLWEGLSVPSDAAWKAGATVLQQEDAFSADFLKAGGVDVRSAANDFKNLSAKAPSRSTIEQRASLYAELLVTCGTCHQAAKNKN